MILIFYDWLNMKKSSNPCMIFDEMNKMKYFRIDYPEYNPITNPYN